MAFDLQDVVNDPDLAEPFTILRTTGKFAIGGWQSDTSSEIQCWGVVSVATARQLEMIPEADRISGSRIFHADQPMYTTSENLGLVSDVLVWNDVQYRVMSVQNYSNRGGYWCAIAVRMGGN